jgi:glycosyltransferase involved in cell wall biosynthesis
MRFRCSNLLVYKVFPLFDPHGLEHMANSSQTALPEILVSSNLRRPRRFAKDPRRLPKSIERRGPEGQSALRHPVALHFLCCVSSCRGLQLRQRAFDTVSVFNPITRNAEENGDKAKFAHGGEKELFVSYRFHVLGIPHTISAPEYNVCAFTQKIVRLCAMLKQRGHTVVHYGHEQSKVLCDEHVAVTYASDLSKAYGSHDWRTLGVPPFQTGDSVYRHFYARTIAAILERKRKGDFLLCAFGGGHKPVADAHSDMIVCEPGIGYANGHFAPFKVFESYALLHAYLGLDRVASMSNEMWYDVVIPNYFEVSEFEFSTEKDDYFLFLGRVGPGKGVHIAMQIVEAIGGRLIVAGPGGLEGLGTRTNRPIREYVEHVGVANVEMRKMLLTHAKATILPSTFVEPFCGVQVESLLSGTPIITTDWGAFAEYNLHGYTGYRCRTFEQFVWAAKNIGTIKPSACRAWAVANFSMDRVGWMYEEYFHSVKNIFEGGGFYQDNPRRTELNWLKKHWPMNDASQPAAL